MRIKNSFYHSLLVFIGTVMGAFTLGAQTGRQYTYEFLSLPPSARITALGGIAPVLKDDDINLSVYNPANLNALHHNSLSVNHHFHFAGISNGSAAYGRYIEPWGLTAQVSVGYISYGDFRLTNESDVTLGSFTASEQYLGLGVGKKLNERISAGVQLKTVFSHFESYQSTGVAADLALQYENPDKKLAVSFLVRNLGGELSTFRGTALSAPLDIQIGLTKRLSHLPLRFSIIAHQLQQWDVRYDDPNAQQETDLFGEVKKENAFANGVDNLFRHFLFNVELMLGKKEGFKLRAAYNHQRRQELNLSSFRSMAGFSLGFGIKIKQIGIDYGIGYYHLAGATNHLSLVTNLDRFKSKL